MFKHFVFILIILFINKHNNVCGDDGPEVANQDTDNTVTTITDDTQASTTIDDSQTSTTTDGSGSENAENGGNKEEPEDQVLQMGFHETTGNKTYPEMSVKHINTTMKLLTPINFKLADDMNEFDVDESKNTNETKAQYDAKDGSLKPGAKVQGPIARVREVIGYIPIINRGLGTKCWEDVGCFSAMTFQDVEMGQIALLPMSPNQINPKFLLYTQNSQNHSIEFEYKFNPNKFKNTAFNPSYQTIIIVHGWNSGLEQWMIDMKNSILSLKPNNYNVILCLWPNGAKQLNYALSAANTQVVGAMIAYFVNRICMDTYGRNVTTNHNFYLIGHSLGAHTVGFAGKRLINPKLSRITGLDPAGPGFEAHSTNIRLAYTDATEVDIIHSDMSTFVLNGLGLNDTIGDVDFYPNGGSMQPGCPQTDLVVSLLKSSATLSCSHCRAYQFGYSLNKPDDICLPVAYECNSYSVYAEGRCANCDPDSSKINQCQLMGLYPAQWRSTKINDKYFKGKGHKLYLNTAGGDPYCLYHYQVAIHVTAASDAGSRGEYSLYIEGKHEGKTVNLTVYRLFSQIYPGKIHTFLLTFSASVTNITAARFNWFKFANLQYSKYKNKGKQLGIQFIEINYMSHTFEPIRKDMSVLLCPANTQPVTPDGPSLEFTKCKNKDGLTKSAIHMSSGDLVPFTNSKDIVSVDYNNRFSLTHILNPTPPENLTINKVDTSNIHNLIVPRHAKTKNSSSSSSGPIEGIMDFFKSL